MSDEAMTKPRTRTEQIRQRLAKASRAFSWMGAVGLAKDDIVYLLNRVDWLEQELNTYREREAAPMNGVIDFAGIKVSRDLAPQILDEANGARVLTRKGKRYKLARANDTFVVTEDRG